jgi:HEPN domain-containing protein
MTKKSKSSSPEVSEGPSKFLAVNYLTDAQEYRTAAHVLAESQFERITSPQYFLIAQSIELYLKAYFIAAGGDPSELKKFDTRHSLTKLLEKASGRGYTPRSEKTNIVIEMLEPHHADHSFRYRKVGFKTYPTIREGLDTLKRMDREIAPIVARSISA